MDDTIKGMIKGYLDTFDMYVISSPSLQQQVDDFKKKMTQFANENSDLMTFYTKLANSGLTEEHSTLITQVAMAAMENANAADCCRDAAYHVSTDANTNVISVKEFVEQYRESYNEVKKSIYRKRGEAAYEKIFAVADRTDDMLEAQILLEEERLLWNIVTEDSIDIFEANLEAMDPLQRQQTFTLENQIDVYKKVQSDEELDYTMQKLEFPIFKFVQQQILHNMITPSWFTGLILTIDPPPPGYSISKLEAQLTGGKKERLMGFITNYKALKRTVNFLKEFYNTTFNDLLSNESSKIWLLAPSNADELGRIKGCLHPHNYEAFSDILQNEIMSDIPLIEILKRQSEKQVWFGFESNKEESDYRDMVKAKAAQLNAHLTYYKYISKQ